MTGIIGIIASLTVLSVLWFLARSRHVETWMNRIMKKFLNRWTQLKVFDSLAKRAKNREGENVHQQAVDEQKRENAIQTRQEKKYEEKRRKRNR
jgi:hypothetical protein